MSQPRKRVAILISGRGSNMAALITAAREADFPAQIVAVISDHADAQGLLIAKANGIPAEAIERKDFASKQAHDQAIDARLRGFDTELICLAGYMRLLTEDFVEAWMGRMINIHPSLLPLFPGLDTHRRAIDAGVRLHGCSVHFVTPAMDQGPIIAQAAVPVLPKDDEPTLSARVLKAEHQLYPLVLSLVAQGLARLDNGSVKLDESTGVAAAASLSSARQPGGEIDVEALARFTP